jgi:hypothetical protein
MPAIIIIKAKLTKAQLVKIWELSGESAKGEPLKNLADYASDYIAQALEQEFGFLVGNTFEL